MEETNTQIFRYHLSGLPGHMVILFVVLILRNSSCICACMQEAHYTAVHAAGDRGGLPQLDIRLQARQPDCGADQPGVGCLSGLLRAVLLLPLPRLSPAASAQLQARSVFFVFEFEFRRIAILLPPVPHFPPTAGAFRLDSNTILIKKLNSDGWRSRQQEKPSSGGPAISVYSVPST